MQINSYLKQAWLR